MLNATHKTLNARVCQTHIFIICQSNMLAKQSLSRVNICFCKKKFRRVGFQGVTRIRKDFNTLCALTKILIRADYRPVLPHRAPTQCYFLAPKVNNDLYIQSLFQVTKWNCSWFGGKRLLDSCKILQITYILYFL